MAIVPLFILYLIYVGSLIREKRRWQYEYDHRDPLDQRFWDTDQWSQYYYEQDC